MDLSDPKQRAIFFDVHDGLPRQGPGSFESTKRALEMAGPLPAAPRVLDIGCGPGMQTLHLAELLPTATIAAVDSYAPFIEDLKSRSVVAGCAERIEPMVGDMAALPFEPGSFDLIWCEGAAYFLGVEQALLNWRSLLSPGGALALSEAVWLKDNENEAPQRVRACWDEYPAMKDVPANRALVAKSGYELKGDFVLPVSDWLEEYYAPMQKRLIALAEKYKDDPVGQAVMAEIQEEINVCRQFSDFYSYVFLAMRRT